MRAGLLNRRLVFQKYTETRGDSGAMTRSWYDWRTVWGSVSPNSGAKFFAADQIQSRVTHTIRVRYQDGFRTNQRIKHEAEPGLFQYFEIESVIPLRDDKHHLDIMCVLREAEGFRDG